MRPLGADPPARKVLRATPFSLSALERLDHLLALIWLVCACLVGHAPGLSRDCPSFHEVCTCTAYCTIPHNAITSHVRSDRSYMRARARQPSVGRSRRRVCVCVVGTTATRQEIMPVGVRDKYGTGTGSIYAREAPHAPPTRAWLSHSSSNASSTFRSRAKIMGTALRHICCARQRIGTHSSVLLIGDSQLQAVHEHLCDPNSKSAYRRLRSGQRIAAADECIKSHTLLLFVVAAGKWAKHFPSYHTAEVALKRLIPQVDTPAVKPTAVVTNFAAPHLLHVHPARPFFDADSLAPPRPRCYPQSTCADYRGLLSFEDWMSNDVTAFRQHLGGLTRIVFFTPNWICDEKLYASYKKQLQPSATPWRSCTAWVRTARGRGGSPISQAEAFDLCNRFTFTGAGTIAMAKRMQEAAVRLKTGLLDANAITRSRCNETLDARHYPSLVPLQAEQLAIALS